MRVSYILPVSLSLTALQGAPQANFGERNKNSSQEQEVALTGAARHHTNLSLRLLSHIDSQLLPVQDIQGGGHGVSEYRVESSTDRTVS